MNCYNPGMKGFRRRDYLIAALIIGGVMIIWFLLFATIFKLIPGEVSLPIMAAIGFLLYWFFYRKPEDKNGKS